MSWQRCLHRHRLGIEGGRSDRFAASCCMLLCNLNLHLRLTVCGRAFHCLNYEMKMRIEYEIRVNNLDETRMNEPHGRCFPTPRDEQRGGA